MDPLTGQVALVTDGGSETGAAIARHVARAGATVVLYDRDAERTDRAAAFIRSAWGTTAVQIGNPFARKQDKVIGDVVRTCSGLDHLVLLQRKGKAATPLLEAALPHLGARGHGMVVVIGESDDQPRIGALEEALGSCRRLLEQHGAAGVRIYGVCGLVPDAELGPVVAHLAETRPDDEMDGRVVVVPAG